MPWCLLPGLPGRGNLLRVSAIPDTYPAMQAQLWVPLMSLLGVGVGGGLSFLTQFTIQRHAARNEERRLSRELSEARRAERLDLLRQFNAAAQQAERTAEERRSAPDWSAATTPRWLGAARDVMDTIWICERMIQVLFSASVHERARAYAKAIDHILWEEASAVGSTDPMWDYLQGPKAEFLTAVRAELA